MRPTSLFILTAVLILLRRTESRRDKRPQEGYYKGNPKHEVPVPQWYYLPQGSCNASDEYWQLYYGDLLISKRLVQDDERYTAPLDEILHFIRDLKLFATYKAFEFHQFHRQIHEFRNDLADLDFSVANNPVFDTIASERLRVATDMFSTMVDTSLKLDRYKDSNLPGHHLVYRIVELNVRAWSLYDSYGLLDTSIVGHVEKTENLYREFFRLAAEYSTVQDTRFCRRSFWTEATQTLETIEGLRQGRKKSRGGEVIPVTAGQAKKKEK